MTRCQDKRAAVDRPPALPGRRPALSARALLLVMALEAAPAGVSRFARFGRKKSAYIATLVYEPGDFEFGAFVETGDGVDGYWRYRGNPCVASA